MYFEFYTRRAEAGAQAHPADTMMHPCVYLPHLDSISGVEPERNKRRCSTVQAGDFRGYTPRCLVLFLAKKNSTRPIRPRTPECDPKHLTYISRAHKILPPEGREGWPAEIPEPWAINQAVHVELAEQIHSQCGEARQLGGPVYPWYYGQTRQDWSHLGRRRQRQGGEGRGVGQGKKELEGKEGAAWRVIDKGIARRLAGEGEMVGGTVRACGWSALHYAGEEKENGCPVRLSCSDKPRTISKKKAHSPVLGINAGSTIFVASTSSAWDSCARAPAYRGPVRGGAREHPEGAKYALAVAFAGRVEFEEAREEEEVEVEVEGGSEPRRGRGTTRTRRCASALMRECKEREGDGRDAQELDYGLRAERDASALVISGGRSGKEKEATSSHLWRITSNVPWYVNAVPDMRLAPDARKTAHRSNEPKEARGERMGRDGDGIEWQGR
ncbi:hypothetical protein FB451DRAFT_1175059 [Mycena latifolia]|nr:hypothetical protein FB451DRAFT_1175059 [Mycena latifolia]